jgi:hypothetical protein
LLSAPRVEQELYDGNRDATGTVLRAPGGHAQNERVIALGRKNSMFAGADSGGRHWAIIATLIQTAKLNHVEPLAWLTDVLERIVTGRTKQHELATLLPWNWKAEMAAAAPNTG